MATMEFTQFELKNDPSYIFTCTCLSEVLKFYVTWSSRKNKRCIYVTNSNGECILQNTYINPNEPIDFNFNAKNRGYHCKIVLSSKDSSVKSLDMLNWSRNFFMSVYRVLDDVEV